MGDIPIGSNMSEEKHLKDSWFKTDINGDTWTIYLTSAEETDMLEAEHVGEALFYQREIYIRDGELTLDTVRHELWHVFLAYCYISDTELDYDSMNEITASLFADRAPMILRKADEVYTKLLALRD